MVFKDRGIVLREINVGESDKMITLLLCERGKINVSARGARNPKSKFAAAQPFCVSEYVIFEGGGFFSLTQASLLESYYSLSQNPERYAHACAMTELADQLIFPEMPALSVLRLLSRGLKKLCREDSPPVVTGAAFALRLLYEEGYFAQTPEFARKLCGAGAQALRYILEADQSAVYSFSLTQNAGEELFSAVHGFIRRQTEIKLKSLELLGEL